MVFDRYADFYDVYYGEKDYAAEVDFILSLAGRFGVRPRSLLDMGCGTGRHMVEFLGRDVECDGFDLSTEMLKQAKGRLEGHDVELSQGDLTSFRNDKKYDLVVSMFAVMGYLVDNDALVAGLRTAREHLNEQGIFIFDGWFGPAVLAQKPEARKHEYRDGSRTVTRSVVPSLDPVRQKVRVSYEVSTTDSDSAPEIFTEDHDMRFMFVQEVALALDAAGLELVHACPFMDADGELSTETWNVSFVSRLRSV